MQQDAAFPEETSQEHAFASDYTFDQFFSETEAALHEAQVKIQDTTGIDFEQCLPQEDFEAKTFSSPIMVTTQEPSFIDPSLLNTLPNNSLACVCAQCWAESIDSSHHGSTYLKRSSLPLSEGHISSPAFAYNYATMDSCLEAPDGAHSLPTVTPNVPRHGPTHKHRHQSDLDLSQFLCSEYCGSVPASPDVSTESRYPDSPALPVDGSLLREATISTSHQSVAMLRPSKAQSFLRSNLVRADASMIPDATPTRSLKCNPKSQEIFKPAVPVRKSYDKDQHDPGPSTTQPENDLLPIQPKAAFSQSHNQKNTLQHWNAQSHANKKGRVPRENKAAKGVPSEHCFTLGLQPEQSTTTSNTKELKKGKSRSKAACFNCQQVKTKVSTLVAMLLSTVSSLHPSVPGASRALIV